MSQVSVEYNFGLHGPTAEENLDVLIKLKKTCDKNIWYISWNVQNFT
jgi:hypothetical protein